MGLNLEEINKLQATCSCRGPLLDLAAALALCSTPFPTRDGRSKGMSRQGIVAARDCRSKGLSRQGIVAARDCRGKGLSRQGIVVARDCRSMGLSQHGIVALWDGRTSLASVALLPRLARPRLSRSDILTLSQLRQHCTIFAILGKITTKIAIFVNPP